MNQGSTTSTNEPSKMKKPKMNQNLKPEMNRNGRNPKKQWTTRMGQKRQAGEKQRNESQTEMEAKAMSWRRRAGELGTGLTGFLAFFFFLFLASMVRINPPSSDGQNVATVWYRALMVWHCRIFLFFIVNCPQNSIDIKKK